MSKRSCLKWLLFSPSLSFYFPSFFPFFPLARSAADKACLGKSDLQTGYSTYITSDFFSLFICPRSMRDCFEALLGPIWRDFLTGFAGGTFSFFGGTFSFSKDCKLKEIQSAQIEGMFQIWVKGLSFIVVAHFPFPRDSWSFVSRLS